MEVVVMLGGLLSPEEKRYLPSELAGIAALSSQGFSPASKVDGTETKPYRSPTHE
jgi:hypothetical protein